MLGCPSEVDFHQRSLPGNRPGSQGPPVAAKPLRTSQNVRGAGDGSSQSVCGSDWLRGRYPRYIPSTARKASFPVPDKPFGVVPTLVKQPSRTSKNTNFGPNQVWIPRFAGSQSPAAKCQRRGIPRKPASSNTKPVRRGSVPHLLYNLPTQPDRSKRDLLNAAQGIW